VQFFVGTSGYSYKEWKGKFYPAKLSAKDMLRYYAVNFSTVEINNTHYRLPSREIVASWAEQTPSNFRFALKAHQTITHRKRLKDVASNIDDFLGVAAALGERQGPLLFQLPPNFKKDVSRLSDALSHLGGRAMTAWEFRHPSWFDSEVFDCLRASGCALCVAEGDDLAEAPFVSTASWGYLRLRREAYSDGELVEWITRVKSQKWNTAYVYFKHEDEATGPALADRFLGLI
jgi:uncharacterized protein YecE (DUF72 family)